MLSRSHEENPIRRSRSRRVGLSGQRHHHLSRYHLRLRGLGAMAVRRTHFTFRIDLWTPDGESIVEHIAGVEDCQIALATYRAACERWPGAPITLRQVRA